MLVPHGLAASQGNDSPGGVGVMGTQLGAQAANIKLINHLNHQKWYSAQNKGELTFQNVSFSMGLAYCSIIHRGQKWRKKGIIFTNRGQIEGILKENRELFRPAF